MRRACAVISLVALTGLAAGCGTPADESLREGRKALRRKDLRAALQHFRDAVNRGNSPAAHIERGQAAETLGEFDEAFASYQAALQLKPSGPNHERLGKLAHRTDQTAMAVRSLRASLSSSWLGRVGEAFEAGVATSSECLEAAFEVTNSITAIVACVLAGGASAHSDFRQAREARAQALFSVLVEAGDREGALELARSRGWVRGDADYCSQPLPQLARETSAFLAMLTRPDRADCLYQAGRSLSRDGFSRLARIALLDRVQHSADPRVRKNSEAIIRLRLPRADVAKLAESLNIAGYILYSQYNDEKDAIALYQRAIAIDSGFPWPYRNIGWIHLNRKEYQRALEWHQKAVAASPTYFLGHVGVGRAAAYLRHYDEALTALHQAVALDANDADSHNWLGYVLLWLRREADGVRELQVAIRLDPRLGYPREVLTARLGPDPRLGPTPFTARTAAVISGEERFDADPSGHLQGSREAFRDGRFAEALAESSQAVEATPASVSALLWHGWINDYVGEFDRARDAYRRASEFAPNDHEVLYRTASLAVRVGEYDRALALLDRIIGAQPWWGRWLVRHTQGPFQKWAVSMNRSLQSPVQLKIDIFMENGSLEKARQLALEYHVIDDRRDYCREVRQRGSSQSAADVFEMLRLAVLAQPREAECLWWFGRLLVDDGFVRSARVMVSESARVATSRESKAAAENYLKVRLGGDHEIAKGVEQLAMTGVHLYRRDGETDRALELLRDGVRLDPKFTRPYNAMGLFALRARSPLTAVGWFEKAIQADPDSWAGHRHLGRALGDLGQFANAETALRKAVALLDEDLGSRLELARALYAQRKFDAYVKETLRALEVGNVLFGREDEPQLAEVRGFFERFKSQGPGEAFPPAPDFRLPIVVRPASRIAESHRAAMVVESAVLDDQEQR